MGVSVSKPGKTDPLHLCKERTESIKQAIDSRYALSAAHLCYIQSLRNIGSALRQFVEFEVPVEPSVANLDSERAPSPSSFASHEGRPLSPLICHESYMRSWEGHDVIRRVGSSMADLLEEQKSLTVQISSSWDFFDPNDPEVCEKFQNKASPKFTELVNWRQFKDSDVIPLIEEQLLKSYRRNEELIDAIILDENIEYSSCLPKHGESVEEPHGSKIEKLYLFRQLYAEREDASEFITHRAKDFLSSLKDIELRFLRAADAGADISKMLETRKIWLSISTGKWPPSRFLSALLLACCKEENLLHLKHLRPATKVITWNRSVSSLSSSSSCKRRLALEHTFENGDGGSDFSDEFCMISGSHSCTLERLFTWEKKLLDEVKEGEPLLASTVACYDVFVAL